MNEPPLTALRSRKLSLGGIAIVGFFVGASLFAFSVYLCQQNVEAWAMAMGATQGRAHDWWMQSMGGATYAWFGGVILWALALVCGVGGLLRAERPRWPAVLGLVLCLLPLMLLVLGWSYDAVRNQ